MRIFDNNNHLEKHIIERRLLPLDFRSMVETYTVDILDPDHQKIGTHDYVKINSKLEDAQIVSLLEVPETSQEATSSAKEENAIDEAKLAAELATITPAQAVTYIDNNVTTLAGARIVLKAMARLLIAMRDKTWPDL